MTNVEKNMRNSSRRYDWSIAQLPIKRYPFGKEAFSLIGFLVELKRNTSPFYTNTYLPTGLLTIISFIGFVIPVDMVPGRMALLVTIFLMLVNISTTERNRGPMAREVSKLVERGCHQRASSSYARLHTKLDAR